MVVAAAWTLVAATPALAAQDVIGLLESAVKHLLADRLEAAIVDSNAVIAIDPDVAPAYVLRGDAYQAKGDYAGAIRDYDTAIRLDPELPLARLGRGRAYVNLGEFATGMKDFKVIMGDPTFEAKARGETAIALSGLGRHRQALREVERAYLLEPRARWAMVRGNILVGMGEPQRALASFNEALGDPRYAVLSQAGRAEAYLALHDYPRAIADYEAVLNQNPDEASDHNNLCWARSLARSGLSEAEAACDRAVKLAPEKADVHATRAYLRLLLARPDAALTDAEVAVRLEPDHAAGRYLRAVALERLGRTAEAVVERRASLRLDPKIARTYDAYGTEIAPPGS